MSQLHSEALTRCIEQAREALEAGDDPFGSVLVDSSGEILRQDRNRVVSGEKGDFKADVTLHPEFTLVRWAQDNLTPEQRAASTVYTSGEHCAMCAAAHAYAGLGRIVYISSTAQLVQWRSEMGAAGGRLAPLSINQVAPGIPTEGPIPGLDLEVKELHRRRWQGNQSKSNSESLRQGHST